MTGWLEWVLRLGMAVALALCVIIVAVVSNESDEPARCQEDEACWDCETMGNGVCGPETIPQQQKG